MNARIGFAAAGIACLAVQPVGAAAVAVSTATRYQTIAGFGASTAWGSSMSTADADLLWSTASGAGLSLHRIHIDPSSGSSSELSIAKLATARGATIWATPWTPPAADKSNNSNVMGTLTNPSAYATYLTGFVKKMKDNGVGIYAVSAQNEPDANVTYESCVFTGATMATWVGKTMGPAFAGTGVKVMAPETQNWYGLNTFWKDLKADADFMKYVDILATHEYGGTPSTAATAVADIKASGKQFWETEIYDTNGDADPGMGSALRVFALIHDAMVNAGMSAWHYWWVYPSTTDNGALWDKATSKATKRLWIMGNFSRFVRPGFQRVSATASPTSGVSVSAYASDSAKRIVIVAANTGSSAVPQTFSISGATAAKATPWVTDAGSNLAQRTPVTVSDNNFSFSLPAQSVTTLVVDLQGTGVRGARPVAGEVRFLRFGRRLRVDLPSAEAGRAEIVSVDGRSLGAADIPAGAASVELAVPGERGTHLLRVVQGGREFVSRFVQP